MPDDPTEIVPFPSDAPLFYNVGIWGERGYAVPNFGQNEYTVNETIEEFATEGGKRLSIIMHHEDVGRGDPPSINTVIRMVQFCNRSRQMLFGRSSPENAKKFEGKKVTSPRLPMTVFPCPFFNVQNRILKTFAAHAFGCIAELMQSSEVTVQYYISENLVKLATSYVKRFQVRLAMEYFGLDKTAAEADDLDLMQHLNKYTPSANGYVSSEQFDTGGTLSWPQDYNLGPLARGVLIIDLPKLGPYPYTVDQAAQPGAPAGATQPVIPPFQA